VSRTASDSALEKKLWLRCGAKLLYLPYQFPKNYSNFLPLAAEPNVF